MYLLLDHLFNGLEANKHVQTPIITEYDIDTCQWLHPVNFTAQDVQKLVFTSNENSYTCFV